MNHYAALPDRSAGTRHHDLAVRIRGRGIATTIFASGFSHFTLREERIRGLAIRRSEVVDGVRFVWVRTTPYRTNGALRLLNMLSYVGVVLIARVGIRRPDVVIGSSVHPFAALAGFLVARRHRVPFVYEIRDLWPQTLIEMGAISPGGPPARVMRAIERLLVRRAAAVVGLLPGLDEYLRGQSMTPRRLVYIPNGATPRPASPAMPPPDLEAALRGWREGGSLVFGYVGAHGAANGLDTVIEAAAHLREMGASRCRLVLVGDGPEKPRLMAMARRLDLDNLMFADPVAKRAVPGLLGLLDVGLFHLRPNAVFRYGISSNKLFDYMAGGIPVISACSTAYDPVAIAGAGVSIVPDDASALAQAMVSVAALTADDRAAMGSRGRDYLAREHDLDRLAIRLADLVVELRPDLARGPSGAGSSRAQPPAGSA